MSCEKEVNEFEVPREDSPESEYVEIYLTAHLSESVGTKTSYTDEGEFSWGSTDGVRLICYKDVITYLDYWSYTAASISTDGKTATFSGIADRHTIGDNGFTSSGFAVYPQSLAQLNTNSGYSTAYVKLPSTSTGLASSIYLIGTPNDEVSPTDFNFKTATAVLQVTLDAVPAEATKLRLGTFDKKNYPLDGDFSLINNDGTVELSKDNYLSDWGNGYIDVNVTSYQGQSNQTFYFNVPTGDYAANMLYLELYDSSDNLLMQKSIAKAMTFVRNQVLVTPKITVAAPTWVKLGWGKFIDNFLFGKVIAANNGYSDKIDNDIPDYVPVLVEQNYSDNTQYRIVNPYGTAMTQFGYTPRSATTPDSYLNFTIDSEGAVTFDTHITGFTLDLQGNNIELVCSGSKNKLLAGTQTSPEVVHLAPKYQYNGTTVSYDQSGKTNMLHIVFPKAVSNYQPVISGIGTSAGGMLTSFSLTVSSPSTHLILSQRNPVQLSQAWAYNNGGTAYATYTADEAGLNWNGYINASGVWYLSWFVYNTGTIDVLQQGCVKFYAITAADAANAAGTFNVGNIRYLPKHEGSTWCYIGEAVSGGNGITATDQDFVIEVSDDPSKGNVMITNILGLKSDGTATSGSFIKSTSVSGHEMLSAATYTAGSPIYCTMNGTTITTPDPYSQDAFVYYNGDPVYFAQSNNNAVALTMSTSTEDSTTTVTLTPGSNNISLPVTMDNASTWAGCLIRFQGNTESIPTFTRSYSAD